MTQFWPEGLPIQVEADARWTPLRFVWGEELYHVERVFDRWRVDEDWWRGRIWREYFVVTTTPRRLVELYHDLLADAWFLLRRYD